MRTDQTKLPPIPRVIDVRESWWKQLSTAQRELLTEHYARLGVDVSDVWRIEHEGDRLRLFVYHKTGGVGTHLAKNCPETPVLKHEVCWREVYA